MGFGLLLIGYFIGQVMSLTFYSWAFRLVGFALVCMAAIRLCEYFTHFRFVYASAGLLTLSAAVETFCAVWELISSPAPDWVANLSTFNHWLALALTLLFHLCLLSSVRMAAEEVELPDLRTSAITGIMWVTVGVGLYIPSYLGVIDPRLPWVAQFVWSFIIAVLLFNAYRLICPAGDETMPRKRSRFAFINRLSDALEKREAEAVAKTQAEIAERQAKLDARRASGKGRKKKK